MVARLEFPQQHLGFLPSERTYLREREPGRLMAEFAQRLGHARMEFLIEPILAYSCAER